MVDIERKTDWKRKRKREKDSEIGERTTAPTKNALSRHKKSNSVGGSMTKKRRGARKSETERWLHFESKNTHQLFSSKFCSIFWKNQPKCFKWPWAGKCDEDIFISVRKELTRVDAKSMKIATNATVPGKATVAVACSSCFIDYVMSKQQCSAEWLIYPLL